MNKNICLYDDRNSSHNLGATNALFTPHYVPADDWQQELWNKNHINPEFDDLADNFWNDVRGWDKGWSIRQNRKNKLDGYVITGQLGLWTGTHNIYPTYCATLETALMKCANRMDHFRVDINNGVITAYCYHHDGTNVLEIRGIGTSRMTEHQHQLFDEASDGDTIAGELFKTPRHVRKISLLRFWGLAEKDLHETSQRRP
jgi:hypothetical protein